MGGCCTKSWTTEWENRACPATVRTIVIDGIDEQYRITSISLSSYRSLSLQVLLSSCTNFAIEHCTTDHRMCIVERIHKSLYNAHTPPKNAKHAGEVLRASGTSARPP